MSRALRRRMTPHEAKLWVALRTLKAAGHHFRRQVAIDGFVVDFACLRARLVVEVDGGGHSRDDRIEADRRRDALLAEQGFLVCRFTNHDIARQLTSVMDTILARIAERQGHTTT
jgi:very-short-patch-repair endonuclease